MCTAKTTTLSVPIVRASIEWIVPLFFVPCVLTVFMGCVKMIVAVTLKNDKAVFMRMRLLLHESKQDGKGGSGQGLSFSNKGACVPGASPNGDVALNLTSALPKSRRSRQLVQRDANARILNIFSTHKSLKIQYSHQDSAKSRTCLPVHREQDSPHHRFRDHISWKAKAPPNGGSWLPPGLVPMNALAPRGPRIDCY
jgi:hypothetical protein